MTNFRSGLALLILLVALLLAWLAISVMVSSSLAWIMGLLLIVFWFLVFTPITLIKEALWRARQGALIRKIRAQEELMHAMGGATTGSALVLRPDTPNLPQTMLVEQHDLVNAQLDDEPFHRDVFMRSLVLLLAGFLMMVGASSDWLQDSILTFAENQGAARINWSALESGPSADRLAMKAAARLTLEREPACMHISAGHIDSHRQFADPKDKATEETNPVYVFSCQGREGLSFEAWLDTTQPARTGFGTLRGFFKTRTSPDAIQKACIAKLKVLLIENKASLTEAPSAQLTPILLPAERPYADFSRLLFSATVSKGNALMTVFANCWSDGQEGDAHTSLRLFKK